MLTCPVCGTTNGETDTHCTECNYPLQSELDEDESSDYKSSSAVKRILKFGMIAALVCVIIFFVISIITKMNPVSEAIHISGDEFMDCLTESENLSLVLANAHAISKSGSFELDLKLTDSAKAIEIKLDYAKKAKLMSGTVLYGSKAKNIAADIEFFADNKRMLFLSPDLVEDAYGFKLDDFESKYENSKLRRIAGMPSAEKFKFGLYKDIRLKEILKIQAGKKWDEFVNSISVKKFETREMWLGQTKKAVKVYKITWSAAAANELAKALTDQTFLAMPVNLVSLLPNMEPDCRIFIDENGRFVGGDFVLYGNKYTLRLEGEENVWSSMSLDVLSMVGETRHLTGGVDVAAEGVRLSLEDEVSKFLCLDYDNETGECFLQSPFGTQLKGCLLPKDGGYELTLEGNVSLVGSTSVRMTVLPADGDPATTERGYVDLFDMKAGEWTRLLLELKDSLGIDLG